MSVYSADCETVHQLVMLNGYGLLQAYACTHMHSHVSHVHTCNILHTLCVHRYILHICTLCIWCMDAQCQTVTCYNKPEIACVTTLVLVCLVKLDVQVTFYIHSFDVIQLPHLCHNFHEKRFHNFSY